MPTSTSVEWSRVALATAVLVIILAIGVDLRLDDVTATEALPAEDPYTHTALVREHLHDGNVAPLFEGGDLYPAGMHAFVAAFHAFTGVEIYELMRFLPVLFGAIGILGVALLLWRFEGAVASMVGALAYAIAPEVIFRTTMMAPTALDLAILPFLFYATLRLVQGQMGWAAPAGAAAFYLVFAHPWTLSIVALAGGVFLLAVLALPWPASRGRPVDPTGLGAAVAIVGVSWAVSLTGCFGSCGEGLRVVFRGGGQFTVLAPLLAGVALLVAALLAWSPGAFGRFVRRAGPQRPNLVARVFVSLVLATVLLLVTFAAVEGGFPPHVNLPRMLGWPLLMLAAGALILLPFLASPAALIGASIAVSTYPFVVFNPFDSPFWSHRTAVYLGLGLVILAGVAARAVLVAIQAVRDRLANDTRTPTGRNLKAPTFGVVAALLVSIPLAGAVYVGTPDTYPGGWYRLYGGCANEGLQEVAQTASPDPRAIVMTGSWQAKLVVAAQTENASRVWYEKEFYTSDQRRAELASYAQNDNRTFIVVVDKYLLTSNPDLDVSYMDDPPWQPMGTWCEDKPRPLRVYTAQEGGA